MDEQLKSVLEESESYLQEYYNDSKNDQWYFTKTYDYSGTLSWHYTTTNIELKKSENMVKAYKGMAKGFFLKGPQEFAEGLGTVIENYPKQVKKFAEDPVGFYKNIYNIVTDGGTYTTMANNIGDYINELLKDPEKLGEVIGKEAFETLIAEKAISKVFEKIGDVGKYSDEVVDGVEKLDKPVAGDNIGVNLRVSKAWEKIATEVEDILSPSNKYLKDMYPDAKIGYRGSLATGIKHKTGGSFDPTDFDVDAFIVSDELATKFSKGTFFRDIRKLSEFEGMVDEIEDTFIKNLAGYRVEEGKPFTFRIWTEAEYTDKVLPNGCKLLD